MSTGKYRFGISVILDSVVGDTAHAVFLVLKGVTGQCSTGLSARFL